MATTSGGDTSLGRRGESEDVVHLIPRVWWRINKRWNRIANKQSVAVNFVHIIRDLQMNKIMLRLHLGAKTLNPPGHQLQELFTPHSIFDSMPTGNPIHGTRVPQPTFPHTKHLQTTPQRWLNSQFRHQVSGSNSTYSPQAMHLIHPPPAKLGSTLTLLQGERGTRRRHNLFVVGTKSRHQTRQHWTRQRAHCPRVRFNQPGAGPSHFSIVWGFNHCLYLSGRFVSPAQHTFN